MLLGVPIDALTKDFIPAAVLMVWVLFVVFYAAKRVFDVALKHGYAERSAAYFGRKTIHILGAGVVTLLLPFTFSEPFIPLAMALLLTLAVYLPHRTGKLYSWFQDPNNEYEVDFTLMWGLVLFLTWFLVHSFWLGAVPVLFMAFGDGVTGIVRNIRYKKRVKGWEGSLAMLATSLPIGATLGWAGLLAAFASTAAEKQPYIDDNVAVPLVALCVLLAGWLFLPGSLKTLWRTDTSRFLNALLTSSALKGEVCRSLYQLTVDAATKSLVSVNRQPIYRKKVPGAAFHIRYAQNAN